MSVRGYKVINIRRKKESTFNCWHDDWIFDLASKTMYDDGGFIEFLKEDLEKELKNTDKKQDKDKYDTLKQMIKDCGKNDYVLYECF